MRRCGRESRGAFAMTPTPRRPRDEDRWPLEPKARGAIGAKMLRLVTHRSHDLESFLAAIQGGHAPVGESRELALRKLRGLAGNVAEVSDRARLLAKQCFDLLTADPDRE